MAPRISKTVFSKKIVCSSYKYLKLLKNNFQSFYKVIGCLPAKALECMCVCIFEIRRNLEIFLQFSFIIYIRTVIYRIVLYTAFRCNKMLYMMFQRTGSNPADIIRFRSHTGKNIFLNTLFISLPNTFATIGCLSEWHFFLDL